MFNIKNKYDIVETNSVSGEYDGSLNHVEVVSDMDIENGRFVNIEKGVATYAADAEKDFYLVTTGERLYEGGVGDFINPAGLEFRALQLVKGDRFSTTAVVDVDEVAKFDKMTIGADGKLVKSEEDGIFEVIGFRFLGVEKGVTVRYLG